MIANPRPAPILIAPMPTVAEQLRQARESLQLDIQQVAEITKLKSDHVRALEDGDYSVFTAPVYLRGSLRTYARTLKLDPARLVEELDAELSGAGQSSEPVFTPPKPKGSVDSVMLLLSRVNWVVTGSAVIVVLAVGLAYTGYRAWQKHRTTDPLRKLGPGLYQPPAGGETLLMPTNTGRRSGNP
jgi:cytoskeletal protein RodZ